MRAIWPQGLAIENPKMGVRQAFLGPAAAPAELEPITIKLELLEPIGSKPKRLELAADPQLRPAKSLPKLGPETCRPPTKASAWPWGIQATVANAIQPAAAATKGRGNADVSTFPLAAVYA